MKFFKNEKNLKIILKLLGDFLFCLLLFFFFAMMAESLLPTIVSRYISIYLLVVVITLDIFLISFLQKKLEIENSTLLNKKIAGIALAMGTIFILNSVLRFGIVLSLFLTLISVVAIYFLYQILEEDKI